MQISVTPFHRCFAVVALCGVAVFGLDTAARADSEVLWHIVHDKCVVATAPCASVNSKEHYALLKDRRGIAQHLLIPTDKITGIESPALLDPATPNFFADAWGEQAAVNARLPKPLPRDGVSLAVNAQTARSQNQLHIHIDCLSKDARAALQQAAGVVTKSWALLPVPIAGHRFMAVRVDGETLGSFNPFLALAKTLKDPATDMASHNLDVAGATFADGPGFIVLADVAFPNGAEYAGGEDVQDHTCAIAAQ